MSDTEMSSNEIRSFYKELAKNEKIRQSKKIVDYKEMKLSLEDLEKMIIENHFDDLSLSDSVGNFFRLADELKNTSKIHFNKIKDLTNQLSTLCSFFYRYEYLLVRACRSLCLNDYRSCEAYPNEKMICFSTTAVCIGTPEENVALNIALIEKLSSHYNHSDGCDINSLYSAMIDMEGIDDPTLPVYKEKYIHHTNLFAVIDHCKSINPVIVSFNEKLRKINPNADLKHKATLKELIQAMKIVEYRTNSTNSKYLWLDNSCANVSHINKEKNEREYAVTAAKMVFVNKMMDNFKFSKTSIDTSKVDFENLSFEDAMLILSQQY